MPVKTKKYSEAERLENWRFAALVKLGLAPDHALCLMHIPDIVHAARKLMDNGCPPDIIAALLED